MTGLRLPFACQVLTPALEGLLLERKVLLKEHQETMRSEKSLRSQDSSQSLVIEELRTCYMCMDAAIRVCLIMLQRCLLTVAC